MAKATTKKKVEQTERSRFTWDGDAQIILSGHEWEVINNLITVLTGNESEYIRMATLYESTKIFPPIFQRLISDGIVKEVIE